MEKKKLRYNNAVKKIVHISIKLILSQSESAGYSLTLPENMLLNDEHQADPFLKRSIKKYKEQVMIRSESPYLLLVYRICEILFNNRSFALCCMPNHKKML